MLTCPIWLFVLICIAALPVATVVVYIVALVLLAIMALPFRMLFKKPTTDKTDENNRD